MLIICDDGFHSSLDSDRNDDAQLPPVSDGWIFVFFLYGPPPCWWPTATCAASLFRSPPAYYSIERKKNPLNISLCLFWKLTSFKIYYRVCMYTYRERALCSLSRKQCRFLCLNIFLFFHSTRFDDIQIFSLFFFISFPPFVFHSTKCIHTHSSSICDIVTAG